MRVFRVGNSYRRSFQGGPRHVLLGLVPGELDAADAPVVALPTRGTCDHGPLDPARIRAAVGQALSEVEAETGHRVRLATIEYVPNDSPYYEMYYGHALAIAHVIADDQGVTVLSPKVLVDRVMAFAPGLLPVLGKHLADNNELLPHVFFGDVTRFVVSGFADHPDRREDAERILAVLEAAMGSPSEDVQNVVSVSFCENLLGEKPLEAIREYRSRNEVQRLASRAPHCRKLLRCVPRSVRPSCASRPVRRDHGWASAAFAPDASRPPKEEP